MDRDTIAKLRLIITENLRVQRGVPIQSRTSISVTYLATSRLARITPSLADAAVGRRYFSSIRRATSPKGFAPST